MIKRLLFICGMLLGLITCYAMPSDGEVTYDTICWRRTYSFEGANFALPDYQAYQDDSLMNVILEYRDKCNCTVSKLRLAIIPMENNKTYTLYDTIVQGNTYDFYGTTLTETGTYHHHIVKGSCQCRNNYTLHLTVVEPVTLYDTLAICEHELPYQWHDQTLTRPGQYTYTRPKVGFTHILDLIAMPTIYTTTDSAIYQGESCTWGGYTYTSSGLYNDTLQGTNGCDSISTLRLTVLENNVKVTHLHVPEQCADEAYLQLEIAVEGLVDSLAIHYDEKAHRAGLTDTLIAMPADGYALLHGTNARAGIYAATVTGIFHSMKAFEEPLTITLLYPSAVLEQRWNDVIAVLAAPYNGGYDFTQFQWYKNGNALPGETHYYLNQALEMGAEYSALLTEADGTELMSCPIIAVDRSDISLHPTMLRRSQQALCHVSEPAEVYIYNSVGQMLLHRSIEAGDTSLPSFTIAGMYLVKIITTDNLQRDVKLIVL